MSESRKHKQTFLPKYFSKRRRESDDDDAENNDDHQHMGDISTTYNRSTESEDGETSYNEGGENDLSRILQEDENLEIESTIGSSVQTHSIDTGIQDNIGGDVYNQQTGNINQEPLNVRMSVYKLANERIKELDTVNGDRLALHHCIVETLDDNENIQHVKSNPDPILSFYLIHFFYITENETNRPAAQISSQMSSRKVNQHFPGQRDSGNVLVFYRFKNHVPEIFCLCHNNAFRAVIHLSDPIFRSKIVQHYMNDYNIKELETINIAGPDIMTKMTYRNGISIATQTSAYLEKAIASVSGIVDSDSKLQHVMQQGDKKTVQLKVGMNFVRFSTILTYERWAEVLELFSDDLEKDIDRSSYHIVDALEYVTRVDDRQKAKALTDKLSKKVKYILSENKPIEDLYLSHRYIRDFLLSPSVQLLQVKFNDGKRATQKEIESWNHTPSLAEVIEKIHEFHSPENVEKNLDNNKIVLSYLRNGKKEKHPIQVFIHGAVSQDGGAYYKIGQKWFFLSSAYSEVIDKNFALFSKSGILLDVDGKVSNILAYPWNTGSSRSFQIEDVECYFGISSDDALELLTILTRNYEFIDSRGCCTLTEISCLLPMSSALFKELTSADEAIKKKRKQNMKKSNTNNKKNTELLPRPSCSNAATGSSQDLTDGQESRGDLSAEMEPVEQESPQEYVESDREPVLEGDLECTNQSDKRTKKKSSEVNSMLFKLVTNTHTLIDPEIEQCLKRTGPICIQDKQDKTKYRVNNAVLTDEILNRVRDSIKSLKDVPETKISKFLRFVSPLTEGEYNELYLHYDEDDKLIVIPGDRILANEIELFDILIYDKSHRKTYLFQCKNKFGNHTRDACSQIRISSELLWHDFIRGKTTHLDHFWDRAIKPDSNDPYRLLLKQHLEKIGKDTFIQMFSEEVDIIFVYAYPHSAGSNHLKLDFKPIVPSDLNEIVEGLSEKVFQSLRKAGYINSKGYLEDTFIRATQKQFVADCKSNDDIKTLKVKDLRQIYNTLAKLGKCDLSTIAKLELLTLDSCFARYQIGGKRHFELKFVQIKSKF